MMEGDDLRRTFELSSQEARATSFPVAISLAPHVSTSTFQHLLHIYLSTDFDTLFLYSKLASWPLNLKQNSPYTRLLVKAKVSTFGRYKSKYPADPSQASVVESLLNVSTLLHK